MAAHTLALDDLKHRTSPSISAVPPSCSRRGLRRLGVTVWDKSFLGQLPGVTARPLSLHSSPSLPFPLSHSSLSSTLPSHSHSTLSHSLHFPPHLLPCLSLYLPTLPPLHCPNLPCPSSHLRWRLSRSSFTIYSSPSPPLLHLPFPIHTFNLHILQLSSSTLNHSQHPRSSSLTLPHR